MMTDKESTLLAVSVKLPEFALSLTTLVVPAVMLAAGAKVTLQELSMP